MRMMVVSLHDWVGTRPAAIRVFDRVFDHMRRKDNVWFARKDEIARWALTHREHTPIVERGPAGEQGCPDRQQNLQVQSRKPAHHVQFDLYVPPTFQPPAGEDK